MKAKPQSSEYKAFESLLSKVLSVPKSEISKHLKEQKREKENLKSSSRASAASSKPA